MAVLEPVFSAAQVRLHQLGVPYQGVTDTEIKIANSAATSGAYAPVGVPFNAGIQAYLNMVSWWP